MLERAVATQPRSAIRQKAGRVDLHRHVGQLERHRLVLDDRPSEGLPLLRVVSGELERGPGDAHRLRRHRGAGHLEGLERGRLLPVRCPSPRQLGVELLHSTEHVLHRDPAILQDHLGRVGCPDPELPLLLPGPDSWGLGRNDERRLPAVAKAGVDRRDHDPDVGDASVGGKDLLAVQHPSVAISPGRGAQG